MDNALNSLGQSFSALFRKHWEAGTGRKRTARGAGPGWTPGEFADAMRRADCNVPVDAIGNWLKGINVPRRPQMLAILDTFFVDGCTPDAPDRQAMHDAWTAEQRPQAKKPRAPEPPDATPEVAADWPRENPLPLAGLAELELHTPHADNEGGHRLRGRLVVGAREDNSTEQPILLTMREAFLRVETPPGMEMDGSLIGVRETHDHLQSTPGGLRVIGPQSSLPMSEGREHRYLEGEVFGGRHIGILRPTEESDPAAEVSVSLSVMRRNFDVVPLSAEGTPSVEAIASEAKQAILNLLIFEHLPRDEQGRAVVQRAKIRRRSRS